MTNKYNNKMAPMVPASLENSEQEMQMMSNNVEMSKMVMDSADDISPMVPRSVENSPKPMQMIIDIPKFSKEQLDSYLDLVHEQCEDSIMINGFDDCIIGYDVVSNAIIYDGDLMVMNLVDEYTLDKDEDDCEEDEDFEENDDYDNACDNAEQFFDYNIVRGIFYTDDNKDRPKPIILRRFFI